MKRFWSLCLVPALLAGTAHADVPAVIVKLVKQQYNEDSAKPLLDEKFGPSASAFDAAWKKYEARGAEVKQVVERAAASPDAAAALRAVITEVPRKPDGTFARERETIEARDAELPAVLALAKLAAARKDVAAAAELCAALHVRRKVSDDKEAEQLLWIARSNAQELGFLSPSDDDPAERRLKKAMAEVGKLEHAGEDLSWGFYFSFEKQLGIVRARYEDASHGKKGQWVIIDVPASKVKDQSYLFSETDSYSVPYDCVLTDKLASIDPLTGTVRYQEKCKYKQVTEHFEVKAALSRPAPAWVAHLGDELSLGGEPKVTLLGVVEHGGPKWVLSKATVADFRFFGKSMLGGIPDLTRTIMNAAGGGE